jgi:hypothetical protein
MMATEIEFLYIWFLAQTLDGNVYISNGRTLDSAIATLDDIASTSVNAGSAMWAQGVANFIRQYRI